MLGQTMNEGTIVTWSKNEGDVGNPVNALCTVVSGEALPEVAATVPGLISRILASETGKQTSGATSPASVSPGILIASPCAGRAAPERGIDLKSIPGGDPGGHFDERGFEEAAPAPGMTLLAAHMTASLASAPDLSTHSDVDTRCLLPLRGELLPVPEANESLQLTITSLLVSISVRALQRHPRAMAQYTPEALNPATGLHIAVATDTPGCFVIPVIGAADKPPLDDLTLWCNELIRCGRGQNMVPQGLDDGTFTFSSPGSLLVGLFDATLSPHRAANLTVQRKAERAFPKEGKAALVPTIRLGPSVDDADLDGVTGALCLGDLVGLPEVSPDVMLSR
jgi:pyruvate dehydrogenase E2 component (dihydrolipoamide acetyltransferase)